MIEIEAVLSDGTLIRVGPREGDALEALLSQQDLEGEVYRGVRRLASEQREEVAKRFPKILRRVSGYNLDEFSDEGVMDLSRILVGSEGRWRW